MLGWRERAAADGAAALTFYLFILMIKKISGPCSMLALFLATACADTPPPEGTTSEGIVPDTADTVAAAPAPPADTSTIGRWQAQLPEGTLARSGACPFECCLYGEWTAESRITLRASPEQEAPTVGELEPTTVFAADSGFVGVTGIALVAVSEPVNPMPDRELTPGDTLLLLDYVGEGFYNAWLDGEEVQVADFWSSATDRPRGEVIGDHQTEWWVHATAPDGASGWFRADAPGVELGNVDACG